ncbi:MAG: PAS domain S-box protein, partial [Dehalococcoidia bacterium]|nr:PAS domain S-box protein [Dehalococcoidia bacterium]
MKAAPGTAVVWWHPVVGVVAFTVITLSHYTEILADVPFVSYISTTVFGLSRHAFERLLYILWVAYVAWFLGYRWGVVALAMALAAMVPRAIWLSPLPKDAVFETITATITGGLILVMVYTVRRGRMDREALVSAISLLKESEAEYRELFENASDAIWVHDLEGKVIQANRATERLTGYRVTEIVGKNVRSFLSPDGCTLAQEIERKLLAGETIKPKYEQRMYRKDGSEAIVELTTRLITKGGTPFAFQNIARDVTEERKLRDSLRSYLQSVLEAQEAERK